MRSLPFDWRWFTLIAVIVLLITAGRLPPGLAALLLGGSGIFLMRFGWQAWNTNLSGDRAGTRVTYWRGKRIVIQSQAREPVRRVMAVFYLLLGGGMLLAALLVIYTTLLR